MKIIKLTIYVIGALMLLSPATSLAAEKIDFVPR